MKALRIPRKDHDVYCIDITGQPKRQQQAYIDEHLLHIHPVYGADTVIDVKRSKHNGHEWAIVTVMRNNTLEEYRILYPHTAFVTATSLAVFEKDFFTKEAHVYGNERIWFDEQRQLIMSEEIGEASIPCELSNIPQEQEEPIARTGRRSTVFSRTQRLYVSARIGIGIIAAAALTAYIVLTAISPARQKPVQSDSQNATETKPREIPTVTPIRFLEVVAEYTIPMHAALERYRYTDEDKVLCSFRGSSLEPIITVFQNIPYRTACVIKEIAQKDKESIITLQTEPAIRRHTMIPMNDSSAIAGFTDALKTSIIKTGTAIPHGQTAQITMNGLAITLSALVKTTAIDTFLRNIESISIRYSFVVILLEVAATESEILSVYAEFRQTGEHGVTAEETTVHTAADTSTIARAFGYEVQKPIKGASRQIQQQPEKELKQTIPEGSIETGKIQTGGKIRTYYRSPDGKIIIIESKS